MWGGRKQRIHTGLAQRRHAPAQLKSQPRNATEAEREEEQGRPGVIVRFLARPLPLSFVRTGFNFKKDGKDVANASASASTHAIERRPPKKRPPPRPGGKPAARAGSRAVVLRCQAQRWAPRRHASLAVRAPPRSQTKVYPPRPAPPRVPALDCFHRLLPSNAPRPTPCWRRSPVWARSHH